MDPRPIDVLGISETFLTSHDLDVRIKIDGYHQLERREHSGKPGGGGGGLLTYVSTALNYVRRRDLECGDLELLWTEILSPEARLFLCVLFTDPLKLWYEQIGKLKTHYVWDLTSMSGEV